MTNQTIEQIDAIEATEAGLENATTSLIELINLEDKLSLKALASKINEVIEVVNQLKSNKASGDTVRDIRSDRPMVTEDAERVLLGDLKDVSTKEAALELGLSYGQVYSCRKGFTFKKVYKDFREMAATQPDAAE